MKKLTCSTLIAVLVMLPCHRAPAPIQVPLALALKCIFGGVIGGTAIILYNCEQPHYLIKYQSDGEDPWWGVSQANPATLAKTGGRRCQGPGDPKELHQRAWENNHSQVGFPMHQCSVLGTPLPAATRTNYTIVSLEQTFNGGKFWRGAAQIVVAPRQSWSAVCLLGPNGTEGMSQAEINQVQACDAVVANGIPAMNRIRDYDVRGFVVEIPAGLVAHGEETESD